MHIRDLTHDDEEACALIFARAWAHAFPQHARVIDSETFVRETDGEFVIVAEQDDVVLGFAAVYRPDDFLHHLYVDPAVHAMGVGRALIDAARDRTDGRLRLRCQATNAGALGFYRHLGFREHERGADEYGDWVGLRI
ncbi:MAG: GNAT family N-acetyltransferase [Alphaproteobacteria bacterium]|nr:GNAT family N-acetyltransferase [Alphaproteobacteria bacterium]